MDPNIAFKDEALFKLTDIAKKPAAASTSPGAELAAPKPKQGKGGDGFAQLLAKDQAAPAPRSVPRQAPDRQPMPVRSNNNNNPASANPVKIDRPMPAPAQARAPNPSRAAEQIMQPGAEHDKPLAESKPQDQLYNPLAANAVVPPVQNLNPVSLATVPLPPVNGVVAQSPILAFLTGHLERLTPMEIPNLLANNEFVTTALGNADIGAFMSTPQPLASLLNAIDIPAEALPQSLLGKLDQAIAPRDLLKSLGIDASTVAAELSMLQSNLSLEGVTAYMQRAGAMNARFGTPQTADTRAAKTTPAAAAATPTLRNPLPGQILPTPMGTMATSRSPAAPGAPIAAPQDPKYAMYESDTLNIANPYQPLNQQPVASLTTTDSSATPKASAPMPKAPPLGAKVAANPAAFDASFAAAQNLTQIAPQDALAIANGPGTGQPTAPIDLTGGAGLKTQAPLASTIKPEPLQTTGLSLTDQLRAIEQAPRDVLTGTSTTTAAGPTQTQQSIERLLAFDLNAAKAPTVSAVAGDAAFSQGDSSEFSNDASEQGSDLTSLTTSTDAGPSSGTINFNQLLQKPEHTAVQVEKLAPATTEQISHTIREQTQMLVNEGGGSVVLDLGNSDIGKLEIKLEVQNERVGLKILAASDQIKDQLAADIYRLREALSAQSLDLRQVDLGVRRDMFAQQQAGQQGNWGQNFSDQGSNKAASNLTRTNGLPRGISNAAFLPRPALSSQHVGRIQVLA